MWNNPSQDRSTWVVLISLPGPRGSFTLAILTLQYLVHCFSTETPQAHFLIASHESWFCVGLSTIKWPWVKTWFFGKSLKYKKNMTYKNATPQQPHWLLKFVFLYVPFQRGSENINNKDFTTEIKDRDLD